MSAQDNLGRQWQQPELSFTVHRGLTRKPQKGKELGMHWSADPAVARRFAGSFGHVLHGEVPMSAVETDSHTLQRAQVNSTDLERIIKSPEKEVPVKSGAKVHVTGVSGPEADKKTGNWNGQRRNETPTFSAWVENSKTKRPPRVRTYKKPKDMTA
jgi:hypothetical protein